MTYRYNQPVKSTKLRFDRLVFGAVAVVFMLVATLPYAFAVDADSSTPTSSACDPVAPAPAGITSPTGSDAVTYTYDACTGLYVNPYYTWSPATQTASPITPYVYTCNTTNWEWTYQKWEYDPANASWYQATITVANLPANAVIDPNSQAVCAPLPPVTNNANTDNTGPNSSNDVNGDSNNSTNVNDTNNATINNGLNSTATSGDVSVDGNTTAGNATSGDATALSTTVNSLQSSTNLSGPVTTFVANIDGNVQGNLIVDPSQLQPAGSNDTLNSDNDLNVNTQNNGEINNNITLDANTGNADVSDNTTGGNATSGTAEAIANVVNMIDSVISSGKSFIGVININGNLTGDILMPQSFLNSLIASNAPSTTVDISQNVANSLGITVNNNTAINNNVTSSATTGNANVNNNTSAGSATTGDASTAVTLFNLTGNEIIGTNALLVFVNVAGTWVGVILNTPAGTTAAALGGNTTDTVNNDASVNANNNDTINNNVNVAADSGNATVANNTTGGNATSGNAETAVNFLNLDNTQFDLTGWFGILFINVFGTWVGNFGVYTPPTPTATPTDPSGGTQQPQTVKPKVFDFEPSSATVTSANTGSTINAQLDSKKSVLGLGSTQWHTPAVSTLPVSHTTQVIGGILLVVGLGTLLIERFVSSRQVQSSPKRK
jgi:hypothetical protein